jgi:DNA polymerase-3 subunit delta
MIYLLLGSDDFSKKEFLQQLQEKEKLEVCSFFEPNELKAFSQAVNDSNLFGSKKMVRAYDFFSKGIADEALLESIAASTNEVVFIEEKLDKRKSETKKILTNKKLKLVEFNVPVGIEFKNWVQNRIKKYELKLSGKPLDLFLKKLGFGGEGYGEPMYSLWQADSELQKLKAFACDDQVTEEDVANLVSDNLEENVFKITNAIGDKNKTAVIRELTDYMDRLAGDDKAKVISLSGLLAEQFRNILIIQSLNKSGMGEKEMAAASGFASGKLFVYKKLAANFTEAKILDALKKLELLDQEVKTSTGPATLQMLMIIESLLK